VFEAIKHPFDKKDSFRMDTLDEVCLEFKEKAIEGDPLKKFWSNQLEGWTAKQEEEVQKFIEDLN